MLILAASLIFAVISGQIPVPTSIEIQPAYECGDGVFRPSCEQSACVYPIQVSSQKIGCLCPPGYTLVGSVEEPFDNTENQCRQQPEWKCKRFQRNCDVVCPPGFTGFCESNAQCAVECKIPRTFFDVKNIYSKPQKEGDLRRFLNRDAQGYAVIEQSQYLVNNYWGACELCPEGKPVCLRRIPYVYFCYPDELSVQLTK